VSTGFEHGQRPAQRGKVRQRIAVDHEQVRAQSRHQPTGTRPEPEDVGR
jgi:hypothetical protein